MTRSSVKEYVEAIRERYKRASSAGAPFDFFRFVFPSMRHSLGWYWGGDETSIACLRDLAPPDIRSGDVEASLPGGGHWIRRTSR